MLRSSAAVSRVAETIDRIHQNLRRARDRHAPPLQLRDHAGLRVANFARVRLRLVTPKGYPRLDLSSYRRVLEDQRILAQTAARLAKRCKSQHQEK